MLAKREGVYQIQLRRVGKASIQENMGIQSLDFLDFKMGFCESKLQFYSFKDI